MAPSRPPSWQPLFSARHHLRLGMLPQKAKRVNTLQRGTACLSCRRRKMKCDAGKPSCFQCNRAGRASECEYEEDRRNDIVFQLQTQVQSLKERIRELEGGVTPSEPPSSVSPLDPNFAPAVTLTSSPPAGSRPPSVKSEQLGASPQPSPVLSTPSDPFFQSWSQGHLIPPQSAGLGPSSPALDILKPEPESPFGRSVTLSSTSSPALTHQVFAASPERVVFPLWNQVSDPLPRAFEETCLNVFLPHAHQLGLSSVYIPRFRRLLQMMPPSLEDPRRPHPALLNAMFLWSTHFSPELKSYQELFLSRAVQHISPALERRDRLVDVLRASCLLALWFYAVQRKPVAGYYHASAAARLAVGLGLHQIRSWNWAPDEAFLAGVDIPLSSDPQGVSRAIPTAHKPNLPPAEDAVEQGERILAFWQIFNIDRGWSVVGGFPPALPEDDNAMNPQLQIDTVWPQPLDELDRVSGLGASSRCDWVVHEISSLFYYEQSPVQVLMHSQSIPPASSSPYAIMQETPETVRSLYARQATTAPHVNRREETTACLRAKSTALFERASRISNFLLSGRLPSDPFWATVTAVESAIVNHSHTLPQMPNPPEDPRPQPTTRYSPVGPPSGLSGLHIPVSHQRHQLPVLEEIALPSTYPLFDYGNLLTSYCLTYAATIQLHQMFADGSDLAHATCLRAARDGMAIIRRIPEPLYSYIDPLVGICLSNFETVLSRDFEKHKLHYHSEQLAAIRGEIREVHSAMESLAGIFPFIKDHMQQHIMTTPEM